MKIDLDKLHQEKHPARRQGHTVDAVTEAIGKIMVTDNEVFLFVVPEMHWCYHAFSLFEDICYNHFGVIAHGRPSGEWRIQGYTSRVRVVTHERLGEQMRGRQTEPIFDKSIRGI